MIAARAVTALALVAPWLVWTPLARTPAQIIVWGAIALVGAFHGWGRLLARAAGHEVDAALAIWWGIAATIALAGLGTVLHLYSARVLVIAGTTAHSALLAIELRPATERVAGLLRWERLRYVLAPAAVVAVLALVHVLGGAGSIGARAFDDDASLLGQVKRLTDTGTLADAIGFARASQLGGHATLTALVSAFTAPDAANLIDRGLGFALVLVLLVAQIRPRDATTSIWATLAPVAAAALVIPWHDLAPLWVAAGLVAALHVTVTEMPRAVIPIGVVAGALCALRNELVPVALVYAVLAWRVEPRDRKRLAVLVGTLLAVIAPYAVVRALAWSNAGAARALLEAGRGGLVVPALLFVVITAAALPLLVLVLRSGPLALAVAVQISALASRLVSPGAYGMRFLWPVVIAALVVLVSTIAQRRALDLLALVLAILVCVVIVEARVATKRSQSWSRRYDDLMLEVEYARHAAPEGRGYETLLARVPAGASVAVWVSRPELLEYAHHRIIDLRTPRAARLRVHSWEPRSPSKLDRLVTASRAHWLLVEDDDAYMARADASWVYRLSCPLEQHRSERCRDTLEAIADRGATVASSGNARLVELRQ